MVEQDARQAAALRDLLRGHGRRSCSWPRSRRHGRHPAQRRGPRRRADAYLKLRRVGNTLDVQLLQRRRGLALASASTRPRCRARSARTSATAAASPRSRAERRLLPRDHRPHAAGLTPPVITSIAAHAPHLRTVTWTTDELATSSVDWGSTSAYGQPARADGAAADPPQRRADHGPRLCDDLLLPRPLGRRARQLPSPPSPRFTTAACARRRPRHRRLGRRHADLRQRRRAADVGQRLRQRRGSDRDRSLSRTGSTQGRARPLSARSLGRRLAHAGDFNIELFYGELLPGLNDVQIRAVDTRATSRRAPCRSTGAAYRRRDAASQRPRPRRRRAPG